MSTQANAIIIPANEGEPIRQETITADLPTAQGIVGGWIEGLPSKPDKGWVAYGNEESKIMGLPRNFRAHEILVNLGGHNPNDILRGNVFIIGATDDGEWADVPDYMLAKVLAVPGAVRNAE